MFEHCEWMLCHPNSIWSDTSESWSESAGGWKTVGAVPNKYAQTSIEERRGSVDLLDVFPRKYYYFVEFQSGRLEIGFCLGLLDADTYVIVEADRGEDCGRVSESIGDAESLRARETGGFEPKKILRQASAADYSKLRQRRETELCSLRQCRELVAAKGLNMEILSCEYQWDMKKITFYFRSSKRIDFRDLLKDLFKMFKTRIWMCAERRAGSSILKSILL